jgi:hypothetical protein
LIKTNKKYSERERKEKNHMEEKRRKGREISTSI